MRDILKSRKFIILSSSAILLVVLTTVLSVFLHCRMDSNNDFIVAGVSIGGIDVSSMTVEEARDKIEDTVSLLENGSIQIRGPEDKQIWDIAPYQMGLTIDVEKTLANAYEIGRVYDNANEKWVRSGRIRGKVELPFVLSEDQEKMKDLLLALSEQIWIKPQNAEVVIADDDSVSVKESQEGLMLDQEKTKKMLRETVLKASDRVIALPTEVIMPSRFTTEVEAMGIRRLIASFTTEFNASKSNRVDNIKLGCDEINGYVVEPDAVFSFNDVVGPRTTERGFKTADVILDSELVPGTGGGICQLSTTLYNTALLANLEIVSRKNHGIPVSYVGLGMDATVAYPYIDLKFRNTTGSHLIIRTKMGYNTLTVSFYGDSPEDVSIEIISNVIEEIQPETIEERDPLLGSGETEIVKEGALGYKVESYRIVKVAGDEVKREFLYLDRYNPRHRIIRKGYDIPLTDGFQNFPDLKTLMYEGLN